MVNHDSFICHYYKPVTFFSRCVLARIACPLCLWHGHGDLLSAFAVNGRAESWSDGYHGSDWGTRFNQFFQECHRVLRRP
jgi:hypothetical protein